MLTSVGRFWQTSRIAGELCTCHHESICSFMGAPWLDHLWASAALSPLLWGIVLCALSTVGLFYATHKVARGRTIHLSDFFDGIKLYWWRSLIWVIVNIVVVGMLVFNVLMYPQMFASILGVLFGGLAIAALVFWVVMQLYFWPLFLKAQGVPPG